MLEYATSYEQRIDSVRADQLMRYARNTLSTENYTIGVVNPGTASDGEVNGE